MSKQSQDSTHIPREIELLLKVAWQNRNTLAGMSEDRIEEFLYKIYSSWGSVSSDRHKALEQMQAEHKEHKEPQGTWTFSDRTTNTSSRYRFMIRLKSNAANIEQFRDSIIKLAQKLPGYVSHKYLSKTSDYDTRIDPLIIYTHSNPEDKAYEELHDLVAQGAAYGLIKTGSVALYREALTGFYTGVQPTEAQQEKGAESFGSTFTRAMAKGIAFHFTMLNAMKGSLREDQLRTLYDDQGAFNQTVLSAIKDFGIRQTGQSKGSSSQSNSKSSSQSSSNNSNSDNAASIFGNAETIDTQNLSFEQFLIVINAMIEQQNRAAIQFSYHYQHNSYAAYQDLVAANQRFGRLKDGTIVFVYRGG